MSTTGNSHQYEYQHEHEYKHISMDVCSVFVCAFAKTIRIKWENLNSEFNIRLHLKRFYILLGCMPLCYCGCSCNCVV